MNLFNNKYEVSTSEGFKSFDGVRRLPKKQSVMKITFENNSFIKVTSNHEFVVDDFEVMAKNLKVGDSLQSFDKKIKITKIKKLKKKIWVYDLLEVKSSGNSYFTEGVLSHNCVFIGSSSTLVDPDILERIEIKDPINFKFGHLLHIFEEPIERARYVLGVDTAKGTGKDYSVIQVLKIINRQKLEQVAIYRSNTISTTNYAQVVIEVSKYYNQAEIMIENNDIGDGVANNIWHVFEYDKIINCDRKGIGIRSTKKSKLEANLFLKKYMENGWLTLCDLNTRNELVRYEEKEGKMNIFAAGENENDDTVTALLWATFFLSTIHYEDENETFEGIPAIEEKNRIPDNYPLIIVSDGTTPYLDEENIKFLEEGGSFDSGLLF